MDTLAYQLNGPVASETFHHSSIARITERQAKFIVRIGSNHLLILDFMNGASGAREAIGRTHSVRVVQKHDLTPTIATPHLCFERIQRMLKRPLHEHLRHFAKTPIFLRLSSQGASPASPEHPLPDASSQ